MLYLEPNPKYYNIRDYANSFNDMPFRFLGSSGLKVSAVGLGTWKFGLPETGDEARVGEKAAMEIFDRAIELGVSFWDTANRYNNTSGNSERVIGRWLKNNPEMRRSVNIATKMYAQMDGFTPNHMGLSRTNIIDSVHASLERMQADYVDVLYFHRPDPVRPIDEALAAVEDLIREDCVRYLAVSAFTVKQLEEYKAINEKHFTCRTRICAVQNRFNILDGETPECSGVRQYCADNGISYMAWSPLAQGLLTGRYLEPAARGGDNRLKTEAELSMLKDEKVVNKIRALMDLANELGVKLPQLILAYMLTLPGMGPVIPASSSVTQLEQNAAAAKIMLSEEFCERIRGIVE